MTGEELIKEYNKPNMIWNIGSKVPRNSIGCNEYWYYLEYGICQTFTDKELLEMSEKEIDNLFRLANKIGENLY